MSDLMWSVDSLVLKDNVVFGFGWLFHPEQELQGLALRLEVEGGSARESVVIKADAGKPREDVARAFPEKPQALHSGYVVFGAFPEGRRLVGASLDAHLASGDVLSRPVPEEALMRLDGADEARVRRQALRQFIVFFRRGLHLVRERRFTSLFEKVRRYLRGRPKTQLSRPADLGRLLNAKERANLMLVVDHDLGGGANHYRERMVTDAVAAGRTALILTYHVGTLSHVLLVRNSRLSLRVAIPGKAFVLEALGGLRVKELIYNTGVSFPRPEDIPQLLITLKKATGARLKVLAHDFFSVCPSHFLLDGEGRYCGIPDLSRCASCLPQNQHGFTTLFAARDIAQWRAVWGAMLVAADEVVAFSNNTADLLRKAYPQLAGRSVAVVPHVVQHVKARPTVTNVQSLRIGVVGQIGLHKGAAVVQQLAREIRRRGDDIRITVIGAIEAKCDPAIVSQTGPYGHDELPALIEESGANIMLFPSVWPETFSYVVQELKEMHLPVAAFDLGAPAERLVGYARGRILQSVDAPAVLDELIDFHRTVYPAS